jgi:hypothetical protein
MQRYRVCLNVERFIEADDADEAADQFKDDETVFYEIETELIGNEEETKDAQATAPS